MQKFFGGLILGLFALGFAIAQIGVPSGGGAGGWGLLGNTIAATSWFGSKNNQDVTVKRNNIEVARAKLVGSDTVLQATERFKTMKGLQRNIRTVTSGAIVLNPHSEYVSWAGTTDAGVTFATLVLADAGVEYVIENNGTANLIPTVAPIIGEINAVQKPTLAVIKPGKRVLIVWDGTNFTTRDTATSGETGQMIQERIAPTISNVTLMGGFVSEAPSAVNGTITADTVNYKSVTKRGWNMSIPGALTSQFIYNPSAAPIVFGAAQVIGLWVYIPNPAAFTVFSVEMFLDAAISKQWSRGAVLSELKAGWNFLRFNGMDGVAIANLPAWGNMYRFRIVTVTTGAASYTVGRVWAESRPKASIIFVDDGAYATFMRSTNNGRGYQQMKNRGYPVEMAISPGVNGGFVGTVSERISAAEIKKYGSENNNVVGYHSWDASVTASMTADQLREDSLKSIRWISSQGYPYPEWRAAFTQNLATNAAAVQDMHVALATSTGVSGINTWPPATGVTGATLYNITRTGIQGRTTAAIDDIFLQLQTGHSVVTFYTHGIGVPGVTADAAAATQAEWDYWLAKVDAGVAAGWLEVTTLRELFRRSGGRIVDYGGEAFMEWPSPDGKTIRKSIQGSAAVANAADTASNAVAVGNTFTKTAHGFVVGDVLRKSSGVWLKAQAVGPSTDTVTTNAICMVSAVVSVDQFVCANSGIVGGLTLTDGQPYFLSTTVAGGLQTPGPAAGSGAFWASVGQSVSTTEILLDFQPPVFVP